MALGRWSLWKNQKGTGSWRTFQGSSLPKAQHSLLLFISETNLHLSVAQEKTLSPKSFACKNTSYWTPFHSLCRISKFCYEAFQRTRTPYIGPRRPARSPTRNVSWKREFLRAALHRQTKNNNSTISNNSKHQKYT